MYSQVCFNLYGLRLNTYTVLLIVGIQITNLPHQHIKRRTAQAPKHAAVVGDKRTMRRSHTVDSARSGKPKDAPGGLYRSELNRQEVEEGFGMGMALPSSARNSAHTKVRTVYNILSLLFLCLYLLFFSLLCLDGCVRWALLCSDRLAPFRGSRQVRNELQWR